MTTVMHGVNSDDATRYKALKIDADVGGLIVTDHVHHEIHEGEMFTASYVLPHGSELGNDTSFDMLVSTSTKIPHLFGTVSVGGDAEILWYEGTTTTDDGTEITVYNMNRNSSEAPVEDVFYTPTIDTIGTLLQHVFTPGGSGPQAGGGATRNTSEWLLKPSTKYLLRVTNRSGSAYMLSVHFEWYSEDA